jgi:hypothetical protein
LHFGVISSLHPQSAPLAPHRHRRYQVTMVAKPPRLHPQPQQGQLAGLGKLGSKTFSVILAGFPLPLPRPVRVVVQA